MHEVSVHVAYNTRSIILIMSVASWLLILNLYISHKHRYSEPFYGHNFNSSIDVRLCVFGLDMSLTIIIIMITL